MIRLAALGFVWDVSYFISLPLGAWLYNSGGYVCVLGTSLTLYCIACILGIIRLWGFQEKITKTQLTFKGCKTFPQNITNTSQHYLQTLYLPNMSRTH